MNGQELIGAIATAIAIISYIPYLLTIIQGRTRPHGFSWFVFGFLTAIGFAAQVAGGGAAGSWVMGFSAGVCFLISGLAFFKGTFDAVLSDRITFAAALAAIPLWIFTHDPLYSVLLITVIDALAFYPTFRKAWYLPREEYILTFFLSGLKFVVSFFALQNLSVITVLYPASLVFMNWIFVIMVLWRRRVLA